MEEGNRCPSTLSLSAFLVPSFVLFFKSNDTVSQDDKANYTNIFFKTSGICIRMIGFFIQVLKHIYFGFYWNVYYLNRGFSLFFDLFKETEYLIYNWHLTRALPYFFLFSKLPS